MFQKIKEEKERKGKKNMEKRNRVKEGRTEGGERTRRKEQRIKKNTEGIRRKQKNKGHRQ